jgi:hypothetical protein
MDGGVESDSGIMEGRETIDFEVGREYFEEMGVVVVGAVDTMERRRSGTELGVTFEIVTKAGRRIHVVGTWEGSSEVVWAAVEGSGSGRGMLEAESMRRCGRGDV